MRLVTALLVPLDPAQPDAWPPEEVVLWLRSACEDSRLPGPRPAHLYAVVCRRGSVHAALFIESRDPLHAELTALDFLLASLTTKPGPRGWCLSALGLPDLRSLPRRKGPDPPCHGYAPPCR
ncbi:hypothetical protein [Streptomyces pseudovenezuelae]|uniref:Uncharacterized protein n=1 Tax=Streptomyces pseudovenezuelae TaxID=67350 RepID=A0ABT6LTZ6_9ACTN|nr:hypothetical protein [Streptomyces pseudovenezuelae]MDH6219768.1 hypothetical protein [Streptomyces pseudovenezuelae]